MLARRGLRPSLARPDLPFPPDISAETADALADRLGHYAFRLFIRGVIHHGDGFTPNEATNYVSAAQARVFTETLIALGMVAESGRDQYHLVRRAASFGGMLEWYVGRELRCWLGFDVATGVKFHARGIGGDLDVVAAAEAIQAMHAQVGPLVFDDDGLAVRGLLIRHLLMPGCQDETRAILEWIVSTLGPDTYVNLMDHYYPAGKVGTSAYPEINRRLTSAEFREAQRIARDLGLQRLDARRPHPRLQTRMMIVEA